MVLHTLIGYWEQQWSVGSTLGQWLRLTGNLPGGIRNSPDLAVLTTMPEMDPVPPRTRIPRERIAQTGPAMAPIAADGSAADGDQPSVLISLSTISYPGQRELLGKLDRRGRGTPRAGHRHNRPVSGSGGPPSRRECRGAAFVPHDEILPRVRMVVGHGGHGTTMRALAHGIPVLVTPMSSLADHHLVAKAVEAAGVGSSMDKRASVAELRDAILRMLHDQSMRATARDWGGRLRKRSGNSAAADAMAALL